MCTIYHISPQFPMTDKLDWLEQAHNLVRHLAGARSVSPRAETTAMTLLLTDNFEPLNPPAPVFADINIALGVHGDVERLVELTWKLPSPAEAR